MSAASAESSEPTRPPFANASPARIREALTDDDAAAFDRQWTEVMARATRQLDLTEVLDVLDVWRRVAWLTTAHGPEAYHRALESAEQRLRTGERADRALSWRQLKVELGLAE